MSTTVENKRRISFIEGCRDWKKVDERHFISPCRI